MFNEIITETALKAREDKAEFCEGDYYKPYFADSEAYKVIICGKCGKPKESYPFVPKTPTEEGRRPILEGGRFILPNDDKCKCLCKCDEDERAKAEKYARMKSRSVQLKIDCWGYLDYSYAIPKKTRCPELETTEFIKYESNKHIKACKTYLKKLSSMMEQHKGLFLSGKSGAGKTIAIMCLANAIMDRGFSVRFKQQLEITSLSQYDDKDVINELQNCSFLIIDDFNPYLANDYGIEVLFSLIDQRINRGKITMFTSNIPNKNFTTNEGDKNKRLLDRIKASCYFVDDSEKNYRTEV